MKIKFTLLGIIVLFAVFITVFHLGKWQEVQLLFDPDYNEAFEVARGTILTEYDSENSFACLNDDGTTSLFIFSHPIKYRDEDEHLVNINTQITNVSESDHRQAGYIYRSADNDIATYFPKTLTENTGILLQRDYKFRFGSYSESSQVQYVEKENFIAKYKGMLRYSNLFPDSDLYVYPAFNGVNCELLVKSKPKHNTVNFLVEFDEGYILERADGGYLKILHISSGETVGTIQSPYSGRPNLNDAYLRNHSVIGVSPDLGTGQLLIRSHAFDSWDYDAESIQRADFYAYSVTQTYDILNLSCILEDWCSINGNWSKNYKTGGCVSTQEVSANILKFDITGVMRNWCRGIYSNFCSPYGLKMESATQNTYNIVLTNDNTLYNNYIEVVFSN